MLRDANADFRLVDEVAAHFGAPDRDCIIRASARSGNLFDGPSLAALRSLADRLATIDGVEQVRSMFDIRRQGMAGAMLPVIPHVEGELAPAEAEAAETRALDHPLIQGHLLSSDGSSVLIIARLDAAADKPPRLGEVVTRIENLLADHNADRGNGVLKLALTGMPALREQAALALRRDMLFFNSLGLGLAVVLSAAVARSLRSTIVACVPPFVGAVWAMGIVGLCGVPVNLLTSVVPSLALVVGTCDSIHFIEDMRRSARRGVAGVAASSGAIRRVGAACGLTSLVTAIGFASLAAARIDAVRIFGLAAAAGAVASFLAVTLLTPLLASTSAFSGMRLGRSSRLAGRLANVLTAFSVRHPRSISAVGCAATLLLAFLATGLDADNRVIDSLPQEAVASQTLTRVDREFGGAMGVDVVVRWPEDLGWLDAGVLESLDDVHSVLDESGGITRAISLATVAKTVPQRARQRLDPAEFRDLVDEENRMAIVRARVGDLGSRTLEGVYARIDAGLAGLAADRPGWTFELAGMSVVSARNIRQLVHDLGSSLLLEVAVIRRGLPLAAGWPREPDPERVSARGHRRTARVARKIARSGHGDRVQRLPGAGRGRYGARARGAEASAARGAVDRDRRPPCRGGNGQCGRARRPRAGDRIRGRDGEFRAGAITIRDACLRRRGRGHGRRTRLSAGAPGGHRRLRATTADRSARRHFRKPCAVLDSPGKRPPIRRQVGWVKRI